MTLNKVTKQHDLVTFGIILSRIDYCNFIFQYIGTVHFLYPLFNLLSNYQRMGGFLHLVVGNYLWTDLSH